MPIQPRIPTPMFATKKCNRCGIMSTTEDFAPTHSPFYPDGFIPICHKCATRYLREHDFDWEYVDRLCQYAGIPFIVREWERLSELNGPDNVWGIYSKIFANDSYKSLGWNDYFHQYKKLKEAGCVESEMPLLAEEHIKSMQRTWGANYSEEELNYLEDLYKGLLITQNVNGALQIDQARKLCKLSLEIDSRIRAGDKDVDKFLSSYDKLVKSAEFTPKNARNAADFDSFAEVGMWLEKRGHQNKFYDDVTRDVIDEALKNIENYNQRLYINEGGIGDEITQRLESLKGANSLEDTSVYDLQKDYDLDEYDNEGFAAAEDEDFEIDVEGVDDE